MIPKEIEAIVRESGNSFHCKVANYFKEKEWSILVSPYYMDNATNKPREIDLIVEKRWQHADDFKKTLIIFEIRLFIECKYIPQPNVFWFAEKDIISATELVVSNTPLKKDNFFTKDHHYLAESPKVAKMFASKNMPSLDNEVMYKALNQSLNAMIYLRGRESLIPAVQTTYRRKPVFLEMPVVVCNSFTDFYGVDMTDPSSRWKIDENFQLEVNYAYLEVNAKRKNEYFLLDVVDFNRLDQYLSTLEHDRDGALKYQVQHFLGENVAWEQSTRS